MFEQSSNDIVSFLQSDMVVCKDYDLEILKGLEPGMMLCSTRIEPPLHPSGPEKITHDFGLDPKTFDLDAFTEFAEKHKQDKFSVYFFAPFIQFLYACSCALSFISFTILNPVAHPPSLVDP